MKTVTNEMISAAHGVTMRHKIVLGHELLTEIYQAMVQAAPPQRRPLTAETLWEMWVESPSDVLRFARAIERAHGIGGEE